MFLITNRHHISDKVTETISNLLNPCLLKTIEEYFLVDIRLSSQLIHSQNGVIFISQQFLNIDRPSHQTIEESLNLLVLVKAA